MVKLKLALLSIFLTFTSGIMAQEICDNSIDDDNDGLIDLNDDECNCMGPLTFTDVTGSICRNNLVLTLDDPDAIAYQWYKDGIAIQDENDASIQLIETFDVEGNYSVVVIKADGCYISEPHILFIPTISVDLGVEIICDGESVQFGNFAIDTEGFFQNNSVTADGCDSITYLEVVLEYPETFMRDATICKETTYDFYGRILDEAGTYEHIVESFVDQRCDSTIQLTLEVVDQLESFRQASICDGETYTFNDISATTPDTYTTLVSNPQGCDTLVTVELSVLEKSETFETATICKGDIFIYNDISETTTGTYESILTNAIGCDSIITVNLEVLEHASSFRNESICEGNTFEFLDISTNVAGLHSTTITAHNGCDSTITIDLTIGSEVNIRMNEKICEGEMYIFKNLETDVEGVHEFNIPGPMGCDSFFIIDLVVNKPTNEDQYITICEGDIFEMHDISTDQGGTYQSMLLNQVGCDSMLNIFLEIEPIQKTSLTESFCEGDIFVYDEIETTESGTFEIIKTSVNGCDSIVTVDIEMLPLNRTKRQVTICEGDVYEFEDIVSYDSGLFETYKTNASGCDSLIQIELTVVQSGDGFVLPEELELNLGLALDVSPAYLDETLTSFQWMDVDQNVIGNANVLYDFAPVEDTWISLLAFDENGCEAFGEVMVRVRLKVDVFLPNVMFGRQKDDINSNFRIGANHAVEGIKEIHIFDRFGEMVFTDENISDIKSYDSWDGTFNGKQVEKGVYTYVVIFDIIDGSELTKAGSVTVL